MSAEKIIGRGVDRKDGRLKVTGRATYAAEHQLPGLLHGYLVTSTVARGRMTSLDTSAAEGAPGVVSVVTRATIVPSRSARIGKGVQRPRVWEPL